MHSCFYFQLFFVCSAGGADVDSSSLIKYVIVYFMT